MNILVFNWRDIKHPLAGGAEISLFEHVKYWVKEGATVTWFSSAFLGGKKEEKIDNIRIVRVGSHYTVHFFAFLYYISGRLGKPDIVIDSFHFLPFFTPIYIKNRKIVALINEIAGKVWFSNIFFPLSLIGYLIEFLFFIFYKNKNFLTSSESTKEELVKYGIDSKNISIIYHGIVMKKVNTKIIKEKYPTIIFLGRVAKDKGIKDALQVFKELQNRIEDLKFWIVGKEEKKGYLDKLIKNNNLRELKSQIEYFNYVNENKKFELLKKAWILIHPSKKEGWGLNVIEAASQGTPTVGYNIEGLRDSILNEKTGLLTNPNVNSLADSTQRLLVDKTLYGRLRSACIVWAHKFDWTKSNIKSWEAINNIR